MHSNIARKIHWEMIEMHLRGEETQETPSFPRGSDSILSIVCLFIIPWNIRAASHLKLTTTNNSTNSFESLTYEILGHFYCNL